jgi:multisubunit Na+/H+ antiporter MnhB subunit
MIASAAVYFRYFKVNSGLRPWVITDVLLWVALLSIVIVAAYAIPNQLLDIGKLILPARG